MRVERDWDDLQSNASTWVTSVTCQQRYCCSSAHQISPNCIYGKFKRELSLFHYILGSWCMYLLKENTKYMLNRSSISTCELLMPVNRPVSNICMSPPQSEAFFHIFSPLKSSWEHPETERYLSFIFIANSLWPNSQNLWLWKYIFV